MIARGRPGEREATRERVLAAAERLFLMRGYLAVTVEDIAAKAGFTRGAVYSSFAGKDEVFLALAERRADRQIDELKTAIARAASDDARLEGFGRLLAREVERSRDWTRAQLEFLAVASQRPALTERIATGEREGRRLLAGVLVELCTALGVTPPEEPDDFAVAVRALARGLMTEAEVDPSIDIAGIFARCFARLLAPDHRDLERSTPTPMKGSH